MCRQWLNRKRIVIVQGADCCWWSHFAETSEKKISHDETFQKVEQVFLSWHLKYWEKLRCFLKREIKVKGKPTGLGQGKQFTQLSFHFSKKAETSLLLISPTHRVGAVEHWLKKNLMFLLLSDVVSMALPAKEYLPQKGRRWQQFNLHWNFWPLFEMFLYLASFVFVISLLPYPSTLTELVNSQGLEVIPGLFSLILCILLPVCHCHEHSHFLSSSRGALMPAFGRSLWTTRELGNCKAFWMEWRKDKSKFWGKLLRPFIDTLQIGFQLSQYET